MQLSAQQGGGARTLNELRSFRLVKYFRRTCKRTTIPLIWLFLRQKGRGTDNPITAAVSPSEKNLKISNIRN